MQISERGFDSRRCLIVCGWLLLLAGLALAIATLRSFHAQTAGPTLAAALGTLGACALVSVGAALSLASASSPDDRVMRR